MIKLNQISRRKFIMTATPAVIGIVSACKKYEASQSEIDLSDPLFEKMASYFEVQEQQITRGMQLLISETLANLKHYGIYERADAIYFFNTYNRSSAVINWIDNADPFLDYVGIAIGTSWDQLTGFTGDGINGKIDCLFQASACSKYSQNSAIVGYRSTTNNLSDGRAMFVAGIYGATNMAEIIIRTTHFQTRINTAGSNSQILHSGNVTGLNILERNAVDNCDFYRDAVKINVTSPLSQGLPTNNFKFLANINYGYSYNNVTFGIIGESLGQQRQTYLKQIVDNWNTKLPFVLPANPKRGLYKTTKPMMTIRFDDGYADVYTKWRGVFADYGIPGLTVVLTGMMGMTWTQIGELVTDGWEIGSHGVDYTDLKNVDRTTALQAITQSKNDIESHGIPCNNFTPHGYGFESISVRADANKYYRSMIGGGIAGYYPTAGTNPQILEHWCLSSMRGDISGDYYIEGATGMANVKTQIDLTASENRWAILFLHAWTANKELALREVIEYALAKNVEIVTVEEALNSCDKI